MTSTNRVHLDLDELLHPAQAYSHPSEVLDDPDQTNNEKRAILASWASDACAVEAAPDLRLPTPGSLVRFDDVMDALKRLDGEAAEQPKSVSRARRWKVRYRSEHGGHSMFGGDAP